MNIETLSAALDEVLPDEKIETDLRQAFANSAGAGEFVEVEFAEGIMRLPVNVAYKIVSKVFANDLSNLGISALRAQIALGELVEEDEGMIFPEYSYATLYYDDAGELEVLDFHQEVR